MIFGIPDVGAPNIPQCHIDYFKLKSLEKQQETEELLTLLRLSKCRKCHVESTLPALKGSRSSQTRKR